MGGWIKLNSIMSYSSIPLSAAFSYLLRSVTQSVWEDGWSKIAFSIWV